MFCARGWVGAWGEGGGREKARDVVPWVGAKAGGLAESGFFADEVAVVWWAGGLGGGSGRRAAPKE